MIYIILAAAFGIFLDQVLSLSFGADKQNFTALGSNFARCIQSSVQHRISFLQVNNVNVVFFAVNIRSHARIPTTGVVTEVNAGFYHLAQCKCRKSHILYILFPVKPPQTYRSSNLKTPERKIRRFPTMSACVLLLKHWNYH